MTPEQAMALRRKHISAWRAMDGAPVCCWCRKLWPCDTAVVLAALDETRTVLTCEEQAHADADAEWRRASADADRLAEALRLIYHHIAQDVTAPAHAAVQCRQALAAHEAAP